MQNLLSLLKAESLDLVLALIIFLETLCLLFPEEEQQGHDARELLLCILLQWFKMVQFCL